MTTIDVSMPGVRGAKLQSWKPANPRELLKRVIEGNPGADRQALLHLFREEMWREDDAEELVDTIIEYWFGNNYYSLVGPLPVIKPRIREATAKLADDVRVKLRERIALEAKIMLSDMVMPNGKTVKELTGRECRDMAGAVGGWLERVGRKVKATQVVGEVLSEADLKALYA